MTDRKKSEAGPTLLSGGNPQIPKGGGRPVRDYVAAMPGWKRDVGVRLDDVIVSTVPQVHKAVKWNQPFYGFKDEGWFLSFRCYTEYVQLLQRDIARSHSAEGVQARRGALLRHPRGR